MENNINYRKMPKGIVHCLCEKPRVPVVLTHPAPDDLLLRQTTYKAVFKKVVPVSYKPTDAEQQLYYFTRPLDMYSDSGKERRAAFGNDGWSETWHIAAFIDSAIEDVDVSRLLKYGGVPHQFGSYRDIDGSPTSTPWWNGLAVWEIHELN